MSHIQKQLIYKAIQDADFGKRVFSKIPIVEFREPASYQTLAVLINRYFKTHSETLDENTFLTLAEEFLGKQGKSPEKQQEVFDSISDVYTLDYEMQNEEAIGESIQRYVRETLSKQALADTLSKHKLEDDDTISLIISQLTDIMELDTKSNDCVILDFFEDVEAKREYLANISDTKIPTGFKTIDTIAEGGLATGELGLINAKSGSGKTLTGSNLIANAVKSGKNTVYISLEEKVDRTLLRFEQIFSMQKKVSLLPNGELNDEQFNLSQKAYSVLRGDTRECPWGGLKIVKYPPGVMTPQMLEQIISDFQIKQGFNVDVIVVDYPDLMDNPHLRTNMNESRAGGKLFEDLRGLGQKYNYLTWTLSQVNRTGFDQAVVNASAIEGSKQKINACEAVFTINQTPEEFKQGFIRMYVDKLRNNSGVSYDKMLYFKVVPENMTMRDETSDELEYHRALVENFSDSSSVSHKKEKKEYTTQNVANSVNNLNTALESA